MPRFLAAAYQLLKEFDRPMSCHELTQIAIARGLLITRGLTPVSTIASLLYTDIKKNGTNSRFAKIGKDQYVLRDQLATLALTNIQPVDNKRQRNRDGARKNSKPHTTSSVYDFLDREIRLIQAFLSGTGEQSLTSEKICDWVTLCYSLGLYLEGAELFSWVDATEVNEWYYERTKKMARLCTLHGSNQR
jgi:hypothetical protein